MLPSSVKKVRVGVIGASGYVGSELLRLIAGHPQLEISGVFGEHSAGKALSEVLPAWRGLSTISIERVDVSNIAETCDLAITSLPHGASHTLVSQLFAAGVLTFDMSADFRLKNAADYAAWYGAAPAQDLLQRAVYGLPEVFREAIREAVLVAVPGCYPTASSLGIAPLLSNHLAEPDDVIIDAKSGVSGAGRVPTQATHFAEAGEGIRAYKVAGQHRHIPEIEQVLSHVAARPIYVTFTPHLVPMSRGILATAYLKPSLRFTDIQACRASAQAFFASSPSVVVLDEQSPDTAWVRGSNRCFISYHYDARAKRIIVQSAIDNLVKGAAGQAIQCINIRLGFEESLGLLMPAMFP